MTIASAFVNSVLELIAGGENSGVEFKRDDLRPEQLAREVVALANFQGGRVLLGVEDDGTVTGVERDDLEQWVMDSVFGRVVHPMILPFYEEVPVDDVPEIPCPVMGLLGIVQTLSAELEKRFSLAWSHYVTLPTLDNPGVRRFNELEADAAKVQYLLKGNFGRLQLQRKIKCPHQNLGTAKRSSLVAAMRFTTER